MADGTQLTEYLAGSASAGRSVLAASPAAVSFGTVPVRHPATRFIELSDPGNIPVPIAGVTCSPGPFRVQVTQGVSIGPGEGIRVPVTFTPGTAGPVTSTCQVRSAPSGSGAVPVTITLAGSGGAASGNS
jgi:hypothetical protein